jgi:hypothetical protein
VPILQRRLLTGTVLGSVIAGGAYVGTSDEATIRFVSSTHDSSGLIRVILFLSKSVESLIIL